MQIHRRDAILAGLSAWFAPAVPALAQAVVTSRPRGHAATLQAFVDTILPEDDFSPAASALGVDSEIMAIVEGSELFTRLFVLVCDWLDQIGDTPFAYLSPDDRGLVLDYMAQADPDVLEGRFYRLVRLLTLEFYYAHPDALAGLDLDPAPQPAGYLPPWV
jgi:hypothetical protein